MQLLTREFILNSDDVKIEHVHVPEWGGKVAVRTMSAADRDDYEMFIYEADQKTKSKNFRARLCAKTICDKDGKLLFPDEKDVIKLGKKSGVALMRIFDAARKLNKIGDEQIKEIEKNLPETPGSDLS